MYTKLSLKAINKEFVLTYNYRNDKILSYNLSQFVSGEWKYYIKNISYYKLNIILNDETIKG